MMVLQWSRTVWCLGVILLLVSIHIKEGEGRQQHFVLIHGLGHGAWCWYKVVTLLKQKGYIVSALDLTSNGINRAASTDQVKSIAHYAEPLLDYISNLGNDEKVILVGHSLAGCPLSYAMEMYPTKLSKAIFVSAFAPRNNQSFLSSSNPKTFPRLVENGVVILNMKAGSDLPTSASLVLDHVKPYLYNESPDEDANLAQSLLTPTPFSVSAELLKLSKERYGSIRRFYIMLMKDRLFPPEYQEYSIAQNPPEKIFKMHASDHSPFFSKPRQLCNLVLHIATL
jgi:pimeloyl-ACP methyl ester carboxylesterase